LASIGLDDKGMTMNLTAMLARAAASEAADDHDNPHARRPLRAAQKAELDLLMPRLLATPERFTPGQYVRFLPRAGVMMHSLRNRAVFVFVRYIDPAAPWDAARLKRAFSSEGSFYINADCLVGFFRSENHAMFSVEIADSSMLEHDFEPEKELV
jgi:hypothetical protein